MPLTRSPTELTTAATDALLALLSFLVLLRLVRMRVDAPRKRALWCWVLGLLGLGSVLGAVTHGLQWSAAVRSLLWQPLYLLLSLAVTLFVVGGIYDWRGEAAARRVLPWAVVIGAGFLPLVDLLGGAFLIFVVYEMLAMVAALVMYGVLAARQRLAGAGMVTAGIGLTIAAGAVQASPLIFRLIVPFDHNGLFHLIQLAAILVLAKGLRLGLETAASRDAVRTTA